MKYLYIIIVLLIFSSCNNKLLLEEYKLLFTDLENLNTNGYKSYYSPELNKAINTINNSQGALIQNRVDHYLAISLDGFFKVVRDNKIGYTRNGKFEIIGNYENDDYKNLKYYELSLNNGFTLYEPIIIPNNFVIYSIKIHYDGEVFISIINNNNIEEINIGKINIYEVPIDKLIHFDDGIYIINENIYEEKILADARINSGFLEHSNYNLLAVLLRMDYILSILNNNHINNIKFKRNIIKYLIQYVLYSDNFSYWTIETITSFLKYNY